MVSKILGTYRRNCRVVTFPVHDRKHDTFSITITDNTDKVAYQNSGTVKGHMEIHKTNASDNDQPEKSSK